MNLFRESLRLLARHLLVLAPSYLTQIQSHIQRSRRNFLLFKHKKAGAPVHATTTISCVTLSLSDFILMR